MKGAFLNLLLKEKKTLLGFGAESSSLTKFWSHILFRIFKSWIRYIPTAVPQSNTFRIWLAGLFLNPPMNLQQLCDVLLVAWDNLPQDYIDHLIRSMSRWTAEYIRLNVRPTHYWMWLRKKANFPMKIYSFICELTNRYADLFSLNIVFSYVVYLSHGICP